MISPSGSDKTVTSYSSNIGTPPSVSEFAAVDQMLLPPRKTQSPEERASDVEVVLNWMRSNKNESREN